MLKRLNFLKTVNLYLIAGMTLGIASFLVFLDLAEDVLHEEMGLFDQTIIGLIVGLRSPLNTEIMKFITHLGSALTVIIVAVVASCYLYICLHKKWDAYMLLTALAGASFLNWIMKLGFHRSRPSAPSLAQAAGYSFPSGHAMISLVFYGMLIYLIWLNFRRGLASYLVIGLLGLLILAIGTSRIYLGVHYPSDVAAGYAAGGFWLTGCVLGLNTIREYSTKKSRQFSAGEEK
jgi:undecaprenyl-diphosphatase